ncbi:MBOAT family O-acyltransferase [Citrobacter braakii]|uniref:MBOAT family O-acyltransferase n=1 Tax=Citrobacter braakii TaxID=57706 RepID=UPI0011EF50B5|nr:MBOAT family O-acyltransferase [Citrobacter braakii]
MSVFFSPEFLFCFIVFFALYWLCQPWGKIQNLLLLVAGYGFVASVNISSLVILISYSVLVLFLTGIAHEQRVRKYAVPSLLFIVLSFFIAFKYYSPVSEWIQSAAGDWRKYFPLPVLTILMPVGLSFYLFNSISLVMSVVRGELRNIHGMDILLYMSFLPTFTAGPVNRAVQLFPQLESKNRHILYYKKALFLIVLAIIKLFLFSSWLNENLVTNVFNNPDAASGWDCLLGVFGWAWEIYFNFSGYTDLVTGMALLLGYRLGDNFNHPYCSSNLQEFWRRWHISLSTFIRDYIYIPLGGNRKGWLRAQMNIFVAMVLSGVWHGAGLTFIIWGGLHGSGMVVNNLWRRYVSERTGFMIPAVVARLLTFLFVCLAWVFFRASSISDALIICDNILSAWHTIPTTSTMSALLAFVSLIIFYPALVNVKKQTGLIMGGLPWYALPLIIVPVLAVTFFISPSGIPGFIYASF